MALRKSLTYPIIYNFPNLNYILKYSLVFQFRLVTFQTLLLDISQHNLLFFSGTVSNKTGNFGEYSLS